MTDIMGKISIDIMGSILKAVFQWRVFLAYVYVRVLHTSQGTSLRVLSTPYVYTYVKKHVSLENSLYCCKVYFLGDQQPCIYNFL